MIVWTDEHAEQILIGKAIGFGVSKKDVIESSDPRIEKRFSLVLEENKKQFKQLFSMVPKEVVGVAEEIITLATEVLKCKLHEHIHVALADQNGFALTRLQGGLKIENPFLEETRTLYLKEWKVAKIGARMIEDRFDIPLVTPRLGSSQL